MPRLTSLLSHLSVIEGADEGTQTRHCWLVGWGGGETRGMHNALSKFYFGFDCMCCLQKNHAWSVSMAQHRAPRANLVSQQERFSVWMMRILCSIPGHSAELLTSARAHCTKCIGALSLRIMIQLSMVDWNSKCLTGRTNASGYVHHMSN